MTSSLRSARTSFASALLNRGSELREQPESLRELHQVGIELLLNAEQLIAVEPHEVIANGSVANDAVPRILLLETALQPELFERRWYLGELHSRHYFARVVHDPIEIEAHSFRDLRQIALLVDQEQASLAAYARGLQFWHARHRYCGLCGFPCESEHAGHRRRCVNPQCNTEHFPRTDPAIIVAVQFEGSILLGRQASWPPQRYSTLAGFVEPGETLETALAREVYEEAGVSIASSDYFASQPWPFPSSLMLGFHATAASAALRVGDELEDARWFSFDEFNAGVADKSLKLPPPLSISFHLIDSWYQSHPQNTAARSLASLQRQAPAPR